MAFVLDIQQERGQSDINKIQLGRFDQPFFEILVMGFEKKTM